MNDAELSRNLLWAAVPLNTSTGRSSEYRKVSETRFENAHQIRVGRGHVLMKYGLTPNETENTFWEEDNVFLEELHALSGDDRRSLEKELSGYSDREEFEPVTDADIFEILETHRSALPTLLAETLRRSHLLDALNGEQKAAVLGSEIPFVSALTEREENRETIANSRGGVRSTSDGADCDISPYFYALPNDEFFCLETNFGNHYPAKAVVVNFSGDDQAVAEKAEKYWVWLDNDSKYLRERQRVIAGIAEREKETHIATKSTASNTAFGALIDDATLGMTSDQALQFHDQWDEPIAAIVKQTKMNETIRVAANIFRYPPHESR